MLIKINLILILKQGRIDVLVKSVSMCVGVRIFQRDKPRERTMLDYSWKEKF